MRSLLGLWVLVFLGPGMLSAQNFKVVGYLPSYRFGVIDQIEFDKLTHLNIAFFNPDMEGNLNLPAGDFLPVLEKAQQGNLEVFISLAGGYLQADWEKAWNHLMRPENRSAFIHKIVQFSLTHQFHGVDVDLEWQYVNDLYSPFVLELGDSLRANGLQMTAASPGTYRYPQISSAALAAFDWVNMMVYDLTGPWAPNNPGPHSPIYFAEQAISYWQNQGVPASQLTLGVPFYGYDFTDRNNIRAYTYSTILNRNLENAYRDQDGQIYYNGIPTIQIKTQMAMEQVSGIMIWEIGQDRFDHLSLLKTIDATINGVSSTAGVLSRPQVLAYPNPFRENLYLQDLQTDELIQVFDQNGKVLIRSMMRAGEPVPFSNTWPVGMYVINFPTGNYPSIKVLKQ